MKPSNTIIVSSEYIRKKEQQIECLQEKLKEANVVIKGYSKLESLMNCAFGKREKSPAQKYLEKWGVK